MSELRTGIVICSSTDLPLHYLTENDVNIMPISLKLKNTRIIDKRDPIKTQEFYKKYLLDKNLHAESQPFSASEITEWFLDELVLRYDRILVLTLASSRSVAYQNMIDASLKIHKAYKERRRLAGIKGSFQFRVIDTKNLFTGEAIIAHEAIRLIREQKIPFDKLQSKLEQLIKHTYGLLVPDDLYYLRNVGRKKGDKSVSAFKYIMGKALDIKPVVTCNNGESYSNEKIKGFDNAVTQQFIKVKKMIERGLFIDIVCMSYAGDISIITERQDYKDFIKFAEDNKVKTTMTVMSTTAGVNMGPGAFSIAFASENYAELQ